MTVPLVNATITKVEGGGTSDDYDTPAGSDTTRWSGSENAYLDEKILTQVNGERMDEVKQTRLVIPLTVGDFAQRGDTVTYTQGANTYVRTVRDIQHARKSLLLTSLYFRDV